MCNDLKNKDSIKNADDSNPPKQKQSFCDIIEKIGTPLAVIITALTAYFIAQPFQSKITGVTLLSEREKAESQLRADMFSSLISPIVGTAKNPDDSIKPEREKLLVELLALNFHEYFEFKPLLESVDKKIKDNESRQSLRSIMRRITDRQIAELQKEKNEPGAKVYTIYVTEKPDKNDSVQETVFKNLEILTGSSKDQVGASKEQTDSFIYVVGDNKPAEVPSPDNRHNFAFYVQPYWMEEKFLISIYEKMGDNFKMIDKISSTWADLPLTDNMRFSDGNRFSVVPYKIVLKNKESSPLNYAILKFIWFPRGYYTLRERPLDQETYLELVGKKIDGGKKWAIF